MRAGHLELVVGEAPFCVWDWHLRERNQQFLDSIDHQFFLSVCASQVGALLSEEENERRHAALALRLFYGHAQETLLSLLAATVQAPDCAFAWLSCYREPHLRLVIDALSNERPVHSRLTTESLSWESLSNCIFQMLSSTGQEKAARIKAAFALFWRQSAEVYLEEHNQVEFNSIKHGLRARSGGFSLALAPEASPGVPGPASQLHTVIAGEFGSSFMSVCKLSPSPHITFKDMAVNWKPESLIAAIELSALSISNIATFLKLYAGAEPGGQRYQWPKNMELFDVASQQPPGRTRFSFGPSVTTDHIQPLTPREILLRYGQ